MVKRKYVPKQGDIVWLNFNPQSRHEQAGHRPALVLSPDQYNRKTGLMVCCPITTKKKGYPFEVEIAGNVKITGVVLADQVKNLDWETRKATYKGTAQLEVVREVLGKIKALMNVSE